MPLNRKLLGLLLLHDLEERLLSVRLSFNAGHIGLVTNQAYQGVEKIGDRNPLLQIVFINYIVKILTNWIR